MGRKPKTAKLEATTVHMTGSSSPLLETAMPEPNMHTNSAGLSVRKKASKGKRVIVRRSGRLKNLVSPTRNQDIEHVAEEINLIESDKEDEPHVEQHSPEPIPGERSLEHKIDYLLRTVEELKSKVMKGHFPSGGPHIDLKYKSLYIDSQKKIEALTDENYQLGRKLEIALGKLEVYENVKEVMEKLKDMILISNMAKVTETLVNLSSQGVFSGFPSPNGVVEPDAAVEPHASAAKRKRPAKGSKKN